MTAASRGTRGPSDVFVGIALCLCVALACGDRESADASTTSERREPASPRARLHIQRVVLGEHAGVHHLIETWSVSVANGPTVYSGSWTKEWRAWKVSMGLAPGAYRVEMRSNIEGYACAVDVVVEGGGVEPVLYHVIAWAPARCTLVTTPPGEPIAEVPGTYYRPVRLRLPEPTLGHEYSRLEISERGHRFFDELVPSILEEVEFALPSRLALDIQLTAVTLRHPAGDGAGCGSAGCDTIAGCGALLAAGTGEVLLSFRLDGTCVVEAIGASPPKASR